MRAILFSSSRQPYRRGGLAIGPRHAPARVDDPAQLPPQRLLQLLRDPAIVVAFEVELDGDLSVEKLSAEDRDKLIYAVSAEIAAAEHAVDPTATAMLVAGVLSDDDQAELDAAIEAAKSKSDGSLQPVGGDAQSNVKPDGAAQGAGDDAGTPEGEAAASPPVDPRKNTAPDESKPAGAETAVPAADAEPDPKETKGPSAAPVAGKPARKAKPGTEATRKSA